MRRHDRQRERKRQRQERNALSVVLGTERVGAGGAHREWLKEVDCSLLGRREARRRRGCASSGGGAGGGGGIGEEDGANVENDRVASCPRRRVAAAARHPARLRVGRQRARNRGLWSECLVDVKGDVSRLADRARAQNGACIGEVPCEESCERAQCERALLERRRPRHRVRRPARHVESGKVDT